MLTVEPTLCLSDGPLWKVTLPCPAHIVYVSCSHSVRVLLTQCKWAAHTVYVSFSHSVRELLTQCTWAAHTVYASCSHSVHELLTLLSYSCLSDKLTALSVCFEPAAASYNCACSQSASVQCDLAASLSTQSGPNLIRGRGGWYNHPPAHT